MALALIVLAVVIVLIIKGWSDPFMALMAFVTVYEIQPGELYPALGVLHLERVILVFMLIVFFRKRQHFRYPAITKKFLYFYAAIVLSSFFAIWPTNSLWFDLNFFEIVFYHLLLVSMLDSEERIRRYLLLYTGLVAWIGASSLYEYHMGVRVFTMNIERATGLTSAGGDPNTMAITMVVSMPMALMLLGAGTSKWTKLFGLATLAIFLSTIIDTGSRTAFLAFVVFLLLAALSKRRNWKYLPLIFVALPLLWLVIPQQYKARYETIETRDQDESYTNRLLSWQGGVQMFLHNPVTGIGPDDYTTANGLKYWPGEPRHWLNAHSLYFKLLGELGALGVLTFFAYVFAVMRTNWRLSRRSKESLTDPIVQQFPYACNLCLCLLLFTGYSAHNSYRATWYTLGAVTAAISLLNRKLKDPQTPHPATMSRRPAWIPTKKTSQREAVGA